MSAGRGKGKPLMLFLHGWPELWFSWRKQMAAFMDDYEVRIISHVAFVGCCWALSSWQWVAHRV